MTLRRSHISLLALAAGAGLFLFPQDAAAKDPELYFYPAKPWTVGAPEGAQKAGLSGLQACSVGSEFNNGFIIQFDGSEKWVEQMSLDFRQDVFNAGEAYNVELTVPGIKNKAIGAVAAGPQKLVIDLHGQKDLYQAMRDSAVFDMKLDDNNFRFYMVGFAGAAKGFERCMAGGPVVPPLSGDLQRDAAAGQAEENITLNESIAQERKEETHLAAVTEIRPEDPEVTVQEIPYTETVKVGDKVLAKQEHIPGEPPVVTEAATLRAAAAPDAKPEAADPTPVAAAAPTAIIEAKPGVAPPPKQKRLSEMLAAQIEANPDIADPNASMQDFNGTVMKAEPITAASEAEAAPVAPVETDPAPPAPQAKAESAEPEPEPAPQPAPMIVADAQADPGAKPAADTRYDLYRNMAEAQLSGRTIDVAPAPAPQTPEDPAMSGQVYTEIISEAGSPSDADVPADSLQTPVAAAEPEPAAAPPADAPVLTETAPAAAITSRSQTAATEPTSIRPVTVPSNGPAQGDIPAPARMQVHKEVARVEADFTAVGAPPAEPTGDEPFSQHFQRLETDTDKNAASGMITVAAASPAVPTRAEDATPRPAYEPPPAAGTPEPVRTASRGNPDADMARKISEMEEMLAKLQRENVALNDELKAALKDQEDERLSISSDNWNLERATMRYNEAERELKRLGQQLQAERARCDLDKKDLETQLFDPQITSQQQLAKLAELQDKLNAAQQKMEEQRRHYEAQLRAVQGHSAGTP